jgi:IS1 family transposase
MNKLTHAQRTLIISQLCEGSSLRSASRVANVSFNTVLKLAVDVGQVCAAFHDEAVRNVASKRIQCDEIWSFAYAKAKNVKTAKAAPVGAGDVWTWTALDADNKLIVSYLVGDRGMGAGMAFIGDLASRLANPVQLTTDAYGVYVKAVEEIFGGDVDFAQLIKHYSEIASAGRYSPPICTGATKLPITGNPDAKHVSTSYAERQNLNMRMSMRRFTRLTNGFSKKAENHAHAVALHVVHHNFVRIHKTLRCTPAMAAGLTDRLWDVKDIVALVESQEAAQAPKTRGPYKPRQPKAVKQASI